MATDEQQLRRDIERCFPGLASCEWRKASEATEEYNCFAFAMRDTSHWWEPSGRARHYWPDGVPQSYTVDALTRAFERAGGYTACSSGHYEPGYEKVAIFAKGQEATHAARQTGGAELWSSKLGTEVDIIHESLRAIEGDCYGQVVRYLRRPAATSPSTSRRSSWLLALWRQLTGRPLVLSTLG